MESDPRANDADLEPLLRLAQKGDRRALEAVLATIAPSVHRFGLRMCRNAHDAEDVLQDTLLNVARHLSDFEGRSSLSSWVFALTRSACSRKRRGLKNQSHGDDSPLALLEDTRPSPEANAVSRENTNALTRALDALSTDYREVILLRDVEGLSAIETAEALGISVDAVKSRLHRAREGLRAALRPLMTDTSATCPNVAALWSQKLEGDLSQGDCAAMEKHVQGCPACNDACMTLKEALLACQQTRAEAVPKEVQEKVKAAIRATLVAPHPL